MKTRFVRTTNAARAFGCVAITASIFTGCFSARELTQDKEPLVLESGNLVVVSEVPKGDEVKVKLSKGGNEGGLRLLGVQAFGGEADAPGLRALGTEAVTSLQELTKGKSLRVTLGKLPQDSHGRYLGYLALGEEEAAADLGAALVSTGLVMVYTEYPFEKEATYLTLEAKARAEKKGIWAREKPETIARGLRQQWARFRAERKMPAANDSFAAQPQDAPKE